MVNGKEKVKRAKKKPKTQFNEETTKGDPLARLGFGIVAYLGMLYYMIWAFAFYSILLLPVFYFYNHGKAYELVGNPELLGYAKNTIGALGYSEYKCQSMPLEIGSITMTCEFGTIGQISPSLVGVNPTDFRTTCQNNADNQKCKLSDQFTSSVQSVAVGQSIYKLDISEDTIWSDGKPSDSECYSGAFFFVQFECLQSEDILHDKYYMMATTVFICCLISYFFTISLRHLF